MMVAIVVDGETVAATSNLPIEYKINNSRINYSSSLRYR